MKKYILTESQVKKVIDHLIKEQYSFTDMPEDMHRVQNALNKYFKAKNIRGIWDKGNFVLNPKAPIINITADGAWGEKSSAALAIFQRNNNLKEDGMVGCCSASKLIKLGYMGHDLWGKFLSIFGWEKNCEGEECNAK